MKRLTQVIMVIAVLLIAGTAMADWDEGDPSKWIQMPDGSGYDVNFTWPDSALADDWQCEETNYVDSVHLWVSFQGDNVPDDPTGYYGIEYVHLSVHADNPSGPHEWSEPGDLLWQKDIYPPNFTVRYYHDGTEGWYDPFQLPHLIVEGDHLNYYQINICAGPDAFLQDGTPGQPIIYWLDAYIKLKDEFEMYKIGWKSSQDFWNDDAVYWDYSLPGWVPLLDTLRSPYNENFSLAFVLQGHNIPCPVELSAFTGEYLNEPTLYWTTQSETDNLGWYVYRSTENRFSTAEKISGLIDGHGTTSEPHSYIYMDEIENAQQGDTYWYWIESTDLGGETYHFNSVSITVQDGSEHPSITPPILYSLQNSPNPFKSSTMISFTLSEPALAEITIYNIRGELVKTLPPVLASADKEATAYWNGKDRTGKEVAPGIYFYTLKASSKTYSGKMILLR